MCCGNEAGSYLRLTDTCITQLEAQGPSRTCNESEEEEKGNLEKFLGVAGRRKLPPAPPPRTALARAVCPALVGSTLPRRSLSVLPPKKGQSSKISVHHKTDALARANKKSIL